MDEKDDEGGLCFDGLEVALGCTVGLFLIQFTLLIPYCSARWALALVTS